MKFNRIFVLCILLFLALVFVAEYRMPKKFRWEPSFGHADKQPFGCYVFDSVLKVSLPHGYSVCHKTLYQLTFEHQPRGILVLTDNLQLTETDLTAMFELARAGNRIMIAASWMGGKLADTLQCRVSYNYLSGTLLDYVRSRQDRDILVWMRDSLYAERCFLFYPHVVTNSLVFLKDSTVTDTLPRRALARRQYSAQEQISYMDDVADYNITAAEYPIGKGSVIVVPTPLVFTNYTMLDGPNRDYIFRLLTRFGPLPVVRTEAYLPVTLTEQQSPLRFFLSQRPLRWAVWLTVLALLLFMGFTARRRQRPIPVVKEPENKTLEFVQLIGTLYYQQHDYRDLVLKKYAYFSEELRRRDTKCPDPLVSRIHELEANETRQLTAKEMTGYINDMNEILKNL